MTTAKGESVPVKKTPAAATRPAEQPLSHYEEFNRFLDSIFPWGGLRPLRFEFPQFGNLMPMFENRTPKVDLIERDDALVLQAELPGIDKKDIEVELTENAVTLKASMHKEAKEEHGDYHRCEISRGNYQRTLMLPQPVDAEHAEATFKDGMLELHMPKTRQVQKRRIEVS